MDKTELVKRLKLISEESHHYRTLIDESNDPIFSFFRDGTYRYVNRAFAEGVNKFQDQIIGNTIWDLFDKEEADMRFSIVKKVFEQGKTLEIEVKVPLAGGDTYYLTTAKPITNKHGEIEISQELTEQ